MEINKVKIFLNQFNATIGQWIDYLDSYSIEMLHQRPQTNAWSLGQVYVHLIEDTTFYLEQIELALSSNNLNADKSMSSRAKVLFGNNEFPDMALENPSNDINLKQPQSNEELSQGLISIRNEMNKLFAEVDLSTANGKTDHPGFAFFNALEWLQFAEMHMRHHLRQKKRIDERLFPQLIHDK